MKNNLLSKDNFINSNKFAYFSDAVFSQNISFNEKHKLKDSQIMYESNNSQHQSIIYKKKILKISNNSTIFTHSNYIKELFFLLKKFNEIERHFNTIELKFNEIGAILTWTEDPYITTSWSED